MIYLNTKGKVVKEIGYDGLVWSNSISSLKIRNRGTKESYTNVIMVTQEWKNTKSEIALISPEKGSQNLNAEKKREYPHHSFVRVNEDTLFSISKGKLFKVTLSPSHSSSSDFYTVCFEEIQIPGNFKVSSFKVYNDHIVLMNTKEIQIFYFSI